MNALFIAGLVLLGIINTFWIAAIIVRVTTGKILLKHPVVITVVGEVVGIFLMILGVFEWMGIPPMETLKVWWEWSLTHRVHMM